ncbi:uncharacterized protein HD556DRAFT_1444646 [Suillus plorans]|uniref:Uncharacterized protein n=1 Tax=Suillus plorans TaxID=116603 RepID=A0A9P7ALR2_9AGAM|nr:uncharacterized protein HD556DRAFT_1444646 [Suillus plorans]KAG1792133.1 hypothetical protein HD556DRAFT_1444646 [Suillus plorans]
MKSVLSLALFVASAFAQGAVIGYPPQGLSVSPGSNLIVQVERPATLTGSVEVAVVIGIQSCPGTPCINPADYMGQILYNGPFDPQVHGLYLPPYENFTVQIPSSIASGTALLEVVHVTLVGASAGPFLEILNRTITIS